jgi:hypothetical protein
MGIFYDETDDTPTKIGHIIGSIFGVFLYAVVGWLMLYPLMH